VRTARSPSKEKIGTRDWLNKRKNGARQMESVGWADAVKKKTDRSPGKGSKRVIRVPRHQTQRGEKRRRDE